MRRRGILSLMTGAAGFGLSTIGSPGTVRAGDRILGRAGTTRSEVIAEDGMAATSQPLATLAAVDILREGGSAVDAAIAANAMLGLVEPVGCGIGGDLFAMVWEAKSQRLFGLNASGRSPKSLSLEGLRARLEAGGHDSIPAHGPLPVSTPGAVAGWFDLHAKFGRLPMARVLAPAIERAERGFPLTQVIAHYWDLNARSLAKFPNFKATFMPGGRVPVVGERFRNPDLARSYRALVKGGAHAFYRGPMAQTIAKYMESVGGYLTAADLADHHSQWVRPVKSSYRDVDLWELPPNGQGIAAQQILAIMEGYDVAKMGFASESYLHHLIEAKKLAFEDRAKFYADPDFSQAPVAELVSSGYADERRRLVGKRAAKRYDAGSPALSRGDTTYLCTADAQGNMVSLIQSNYRGMGSGMVPDGLGFGLQDRGQLFALEDGHANVYAPHKRPFHTIIPAFASRRGKPWLAFGVMGGAAQPQMHAQVLMNLVDFKMSLQEAGDAARMLHLGSSQPTGERMKDGGTVYLESEVGEPVARALRRRGHRVERRTGAFGGYQAVAREGEFWVGASESRKDGLALGY
jgi:gamma-glutamyltranspeptidase/glutathione hydrolase